MEKLLVILGTNREDSNTAKALDTSPFKNGERVELRKLTIGHYVYSADKPQDDFLPVVKKMLAADTIVFATPVYWYAMSAHMKIFFDRLSDLISAEKSLGRSLKGKTVFAFVTGNEDVIPEGFEVPFRRTSEYFDMKFERTIYQSVKD